MSSNYLPERDLLVLLLKREPYEAFFSSINLDYLKDNFKELYHLYRCVQEMRKEYPAKDFDLNALQAYFFLKHPDSDKDLYVSLFQTLSETKLDAEVGVGILQKIKRRKTAMELSEAAFKFSTGVSDVSGVLKLAKMLEEEQAEQLDDIEVVSDDLEELVDDAIQRPGLRWRLNCLNRSLGSLRKGDFGFLFARPETGKTTFLASEVSCMLAQLNDASGPIVWFNNEEQGSKVMLRVYQAYFGLTMQQLMANVPRYKREFQAQVKGRFKLIDNANIDKGQVERICKQLKPSLIIFDQIDKIKGFAADREDLRLGAIYIWARELAKTYCPSIGVCQADGSAENQKWLTMDNVANAKTSKQAEADWILGIGCIHAEGQQFSRYLNISKNKLLGDTDSLSNLRHGRFEVLIEPQVARYRDVHKFD